MTSTQAREHSKFLAEGAALRAAPDAVHTDGVRAMCERLATSPHKLGMVVIAGMTDASALLAEAGDLVREKVASITIMGGIDPARDADGLVQPDTRAYNNATDIHAARALYRRAQQLGIPLRILTKEAAYKAAVPPAFYEGIARNGHPVGEYLRDVQKNALKGLWEGIQANLIPGLDTAWFFRTFVAAQPQDPVAADQQGALSFDAIWPQVTKLNLYDPLTLLAALPGTARLLFQPTPCTAREPARSSTWATPRLCVRKSQAVAVGTGQAALVQQDEGNMRAERSAAFAEWRRPASSAKREVGLALQSVRLPTGRANYLPFFSCLAARFSFSVLVGSFFWFFFWSIPCS